MLKLLFVIIVTGSFVVLASYSCGRYCTDQYQAAHPAIPMAPAIAKPVVLKSKPTKAQILLQRQAKALKEVYHIADNEIDAFFATKRGR